MGKVGEFEFSVKVKQLSIEDRLKRFRGSLSGVRWFKTTKGRGKGNPTKPSAHFMHNETLAGGGTDGGNPNGATSSDMKR